jgi:hypothetical protein
MPSESTSPSEPASPADHRPDSAPGTVADPDPVADPVAELVAESAAAAALSAARDIAEVPAAELITTAAVHLMSAAAVKCGLAEGPDAEDQLDLAEARILITALAGLVTASAPDVGGQHARSLRDGLRSLQLAFREASAVPDAPGKGPGERLTGSVV